MFDPYALNIYTDGSSLSSPRAGGIGIRFIFPDFLKKDNIVRDLPSFGYKGATNNQMELKACILALEEVLKLDEIKQIQRIVIYTDSLYIVENYKRAVYVWSKNKWLKKSGAPVLNADLWKELIKKIRRVQRRVEFEWVKGHFKNEHNKAVDKLAKESAKKPINKLTNVVDVRRKLSSKCVEYGSVKMLGQKISIRIITSEYLRIQKVFKYKYEIISKKSKYYQNVDIIYYEKALKTGHNYLVSFNRKSNNPRISKMYNEIVQ